MHPYLSKIHYVKQLLNIFKNQRIERIANKGGNQNETKNKTLVGMQKEA